MIKILILCIITITSFVFAQDCYESSIVYPVPFMGNNEEIFKLADGSVWEVKYEYQYLYAYYPTVIVCPNQGRLIIDGNSLNVKIISAVKNSRQVDSEWVVHEETHLKGLISGTIIKGHIFKTTSGNIYEVTGLTIQVVVDIQPEVLIMRNGNVYKLIVTGFDEPLICKCLNKSSEEPYMQKNIKSKKNNSVIESKIGGSFNGFEGDTIIKLMNGQIWQQSEYYYHYSYSYMPKVLIYKSGSSFKMKVDGIDKAVCVKKLN